MTSETAAKPTSADGPAAPPPRVASYGDPQRLASYVAAMHRRARQVPEQPLVYLGGLHNHLGPKVRKRVRQWLPDGVLVQTFAEAFADSDIYAKGAGFAEYLPRLSGMVVAGRIRTDYAWDFGPVLRLEVRAAVAAGLPVLVYAGTRTKLVPLIDCKPERYVAQGNYGSRGPDPVEVERLLVRIPTAWDSSSETLAAALAALTPPQKPETAPPPAPTQVPRGR